MTSESRSIIVGILVLAQQRLITAQIVRLAAAVGLSANNVKSHLTRMVKEGALLRKGARRLATYDPSAGQERVIQGIHERLTNRPKAAWDGEWLVLIVRLPLNRSLRQRWRALLWFDGFRPIGPGVIIRPAWPLAWAVGQAQFYADEIPGVCFRGEPINSSLDLAKLYDLDKLDSEAQRLVAWIRNRASHADSPRAAFVERMRVGGRIARFIGHDPRLPSKLWGKRRAIFELVAAFNNFERKVEPRAQAFIEQTIKRES